MAIELIGLEVEVVDIPKVLNIGMLPNCDAGGMTPKPMECDKGI